MNEINDRTLNWLQELIYVDSTLPDGKIGDFEIYAMLYQKLIEEGGREDIEFLRFDHQKNICGFENNDKMLLQEKPKFKRFVLLLVGTAVIPGITIDNTHHAVLIIDREKEKYTYLNSYFGSVSNSVIKKCKDIGLIEERFAPLSDVAPTLQIDFWSCGLQVVENVSRFFDVVTKGIVHKHRTFTRGNNIKSKYCNLFKSFAIFYGNKTETDEQRKNRLIKLGVRRGLRLFNADQPDHPLHFFYDFLNKKMSFVDGNESLIELVDRYFLENNNISNFEKSFLIEIKQANSEVYDAKYPNRFVESIYRETKKQIFLLLINSREEELICLIKHIPEYVIEPILINEKKFSDINCSIKKRFTTSYDLVLSELDYYKQELGGMPNFTGSRPPINDEVDAVKCFFGRPMIAWKDYLRYAVKNNYRPFCFWKKISKYFLVNDSYSEYEIISQSIQKMIEVVRNRDKIFKLLDDYQLGNVDLDQMHVSFGRLSGGLGWHPNQNPSQVEKEYIDFLEIFLIKDFSLAKKNSNLIEYFKLFDGACFEDRIKNCLEWRQKNSELKINNDTLIDYTPDQAPEIFMGKVLENTLKVKENSSVDFCADLERHDFFNKKFFIKNKKIKPTLKIVNDFIIDQQLLYTMPVDEIDVFLRRQLGVLNEHPGRDVAATEEEFFDVLGQFIASNPDFRVKVDGHETSFVLSGVIKERVKSFFSPSSPLHVSR